MIFGYISGDKGHSLSEQLRMQMDYHGIERPIIHTIESTKFNAGCLSGPKDGNHAGNCIFKDPLTQDIVLFSGNIYNRAEVFETAHVNKKDLYIPELMYRMFKSQGPTFAESLNGDFSIAIYLNEEDKLYLFRDHLGIYPLAYTIQGNELYFSNDSLFLNRSFHNINEPLNLEPLLKDFRFVDFTKNINSAVKNLLPGHYLVFHEGKIEIHKYWFPERLKTNRKLTRERMLSEINSLLDKAVKLRCTDNSIVAAHLSGGLDSGIVAALAKYKCAHQDKFIGYSWSPDKYDPTDNKEDERVLVREQAEMNGITPVFINSTANDYRFYNSNRIRGTVFIDENLVLKDAEKRGINVLLSGYGGDEFISKGSRGIDTDLLLQFRWKSFFKRNPIRKPKDLARTLLYEILMPYIKVLPPSVKKDTKNSVKYLLPEFKKENKDNIRRFFMYRSRRQLHLGFFYCYYLNDRIDEWYINGFRHGMEYRYPLLDKNIVEYMLQVPSKLLVNERWSRTILRDISEGLLPDSIRWKKAGTDPVSVASAQTNVFECSKEYLSEITEIRKNKDLYFIDFDKIEKDIQEYQKDLDDKKYNYLLYNIFNIKGLHEFTIAYRKRLD